jgi:hypothetical protein
VECCPTKEQAMARITLGKLHRMSGKAIAALPGMLVVEQNGRAIALLNPVKETEPQEFSPDRTEMEGSDN